MLPTDFQTLIATSRYARWNEEENRREYWSETVDRYLENVVDRVVPSLDRSTREDIRSAILNLEVMPSMRALMTAGKALDRDHMAGYNCSFIAIDHPRAFDEVLYILTCGTGVGFSCEGKYVNQLPTVAETFHDTDTTIVVGDSRIGWASAFRELISLLYAGKIPRIDVSKVRGKGARLKVFGGRASGPAPLVDLFNHCIGIFRTAAGRKLTDLEVHSIVCKIGEIVVVGGVRRSALISLSDLGSARMRDAKAGAWSEQHSEFALANNSAVYEEKPSVGQFFEEWLGLYRSRSGERGIYYRKGIRDKIKKLGKRDETQIVGTNPCAEIALRSGGLCNL
jgi:ribonucleoside-diphosphate reductase alpha chain